jgi:hypothetical protein
VGVFFPDSHAGSDCSGHREITVQGSVFRSVAGLVLTLHFQQHALIFLRGATLVDLAPWYRPIEFSESSEDLPELFGTFLPPLHAAHSPFDRPLPTAERVNVVVLV